MRTFPNLFRRAQSHIVTHLCTAGREGAAVGELYGLVKQVFLLDDSTVKERILEIKEQQLCGIDPPEASLSARSVVVPSSTLAGPVRPSSGGAGQGALRHRRPRWIPRPAPRRHAGSMPSSAPSSCGALTDAATRGGRRWIASSMR